MKRRARAEADRRVTCRPAPDVMTHVSALLPVKQGVAVYAALRAEADRLTAAGDPRGRGQIMADLLFQRVVSPTNEGTARVGVTLEVVVSDRVLLGLEDGAAHVEGYGPIPGDLARELATDAELAVAIRRLYAAAGHRPAGGDGLEARRPSHRPWPGSSTCATGSAARPGATPRSATGTTSSRSTRAASRRAGNGQGLCEQCNHAKQAAGWRARPRPGPRHTVETSHPDGAQLHARPHHRPAAPTGAPACGRVRPRVDFAIVELARGLLSGDPS